MWKKNLMVVAALVIVVATAPAALWAKKVPVDLYEIGCVVEPGAQLLTNEGRELHIVGEVGRAVFYDAKTFEIVGENATVANILVKTATNRTRLCGTFSGLMPEYGGANTFDGTWQAKVGATGLSGRGLGHGTFALRGDQLKVSLRSLAPDAVPAEIVEILSRRPWKRCKQLIGPNRVTGFIRPAPRE